MTIHGLRLLTEAMCVMKNTSKTEKYSVKTIRFAQNHFGLKELINIISKLTQLRIRLLI